MDPVEATTTAAAGQPSRVKTPAGVEGAGPFDAVLAAVRQMSGQLEGSVVERARQVGLDARRDRQVADALARSSGGDEITRAHGQRTSRKEGRVDRLRSSVRERERAGDHESALSKAQAQVRRAGAEGGDNAPGDRGRADLDSSHQTDQTPHHHSAEVNKSREVAAVREERALQVRSDAPVRQSTPTAPPNATPSQATTTGVNQASQATQPAPGTAATSFQAIATSASTQPGPLTSGGQGETGGRGNGSGASQESAQTVAAKSGTAAGRSAGATNDFQNLLDAAGGRRGHSGVLRMQAKPDARVSNPTANGIQLKEARAVQELSNVVQSNLGARHSSMVLRLDPPELGQLRIDMKMHDQILTLRFHAQTPAGHDMLQAKLGDLRNALEQHGIQLNQVEVEFRPPPPSDASQNPDVPQHSAPDGRESPFGEFSQRGEHESSAETYHSSGEPSQDDWKVSLSSGETEQEGDVRPAETGVDLVV